MSAARLVLPAPAKINLFLHVVGRRADGYHELQTLFQLLDLADEVELAVRADGAIRRGVDLPGVPEAADLSLRAARALREASGTRLGADVTVRKRIPAGGGLGGGSSDAATTLVGLDRLWGLGLGPERLAEIGLGLGADVPVFVHGRAAWAEGVGERLRAVELEQPWYVVVTPPSPVETARIFADPTLTRDTPPLTIADLLCGARTESGAAIGVEAVLATARNDCEPVTRALHPEVDAVLAWLAGHGTARMSGTGASVFAPFRDEGAARRALESLPEGDPTGAWRGVVTRGLNRSPLLDAVRERGARSIRDGV